MLVVQAVGSDGTTPFTRHFGVEHLPGHQG